jgi:hypothetical protein
MLSISTNLLRFSGVPLASHGSILNAHGCNVLSTIVGNIRRLALDRGVLELRATALSLERVEETDQQDACGRSAIPAARRSQQAMSARAGHSWRAPPKTRTITPGEARPDLRNYRGEGALA